MLFHSVESSTVENPESVYRKVKIYSVLEIVFGVFFWFWSLIIIANGSTSFDSGVVIFTFAIGGGVTGLKALKEKGELLEKLVTAHVKLLRIAHPLIVLAFGVGAILGLVDGEFGRFLYCIVMALAWGVSGYFIIKIAKRFKELKLESILPTDVPPAQSYTDVIGSQSAQPNREEQPDSQQQQERIDRQNSESYASSDHSEGFAKEDEVDTAKDERSE